MDEKEKIAICWDSKERKNFTYLCERARNYIKKKELIPNGLEKEYKQALTEYEQLLNINGFVLPSPKYPYKHDDTTTWRYINMSLSEQENEVKKFNKCVLNLKCIYNFGD